MPLPPEPKPAPTAHGRRHRAVQSHFAGPRSKSGKATSSQPDPQTNGRPAWCFFAPTSNRGVSIEGTSLQRGKSNYLITVAKEEHGYGIPSAKRDAAYWWGTSLAEQANAAEPDPTDRIPKMDLYTNIQRREWAGKQRINAGFVKKNEQSITLRREKDASKKTLDNDYRQELLGKPMKTLPGSKPLMTALLEGAFFDLPKPEKPKPKNFVKANCGSVRAASAQIRQCRHQGLI